MPKIERFNCPPKALNAVGMCISNDELFCVVANDCMGVLAIVQGIVADELIREDTGAFLDELTDKWAQCVSFGVLYLTGHQTAVSLNHSEHGSLGFRGASLCSFSLLALMLVLLLQYVKT